MFKSFSVNFSRFNILCVIWIPAVVNISHLKDYEIRGYISGDDNE